MAKGLHRFAGKVALITGAASGIGRGIALRFSNEGASIVGVDLKEDGLESVTEEIQSRRGSKMTAIVGDATNPDLVTDSVKRSLREFGKIDILVNNIGAIALRPLMQTSEDAWDRSLAVNVKSAFLWTAEVARHMIRKRSGCVINISSGSSKTGDATSGAYVPAKHALNGLTKNFALELAPYNIRVNAIVPGYIETGMLNDYIGEISRATKRSVAELYRVRLATVPLRRFGTSEDVAGVAAFLASDDASYMTGQAINVSGGLLMS